MSCAAIAVACAGNVRAEEWLRLRQAGLVAKGDLYVLAGGYSVQLAPGLSEALRRGITLTFVQLFEAERPRDYWFPEDIAVESRRLRLSYNALLRLYQLQGAGGLESFESETDALAALGDFADWPVLERKQLSRKSLYRVRCRMFLDTSQLAKPLQLNAFASGRWDMDSGWREWSFKP